MFKGLLVKKKVGHLHWLAALMAVLLILSLLPATVSQAGDRTNDINSTALLQKYDSVAGQYDTVSSAAYLENGSTYRINVSWNFIGNDKPVTNDTFMIPIQLPTEYGQGVIFGGVTVRDFTYGVPAAKVGEFRLIGTDASGNPDGRNIGNSSGEFFALEGVFTEDYLKNLNNVQGNIWLEFTANNAVGAVAIVATGINGGGEAKGTNNQIMIIKHNEQGQPLIGAKFQVQVFAPNGSEKFANVLDLSTVNWGVSGPLGVLTADDRIIITEITVPSGYKTIPVTGQQFTLRSDPALGYALTTDTLTQLANYKSWLTVTVDGQSGLITATVQNTRNSTGSNSGSGTSRGGGGSSSNYPNLSTLAKGVFNGQSVTITDTVSYNRLTVGETYTMTGTLMNTDGTEFLSDGKTVTVTKSFTPDSAKGELEMVFPSFNVANLSGQKVVVYEVLTRDNGSVVARHENPKDLKQTVDLSGSGSSISTGSNDNPSGSQNTGTSSPGISGNNPGSGTNFGQTGTFGNGTSLSGKGKVPATGDDNRLIYWVILLALASVTTIYGFKKSFGRK